jgi:hypothetical protein
VTLADSSRFSEFVGNVPNVPTTIFAGKKLIDYSSTFRFYLSLTRVLGGTYFAPALTVNL